MENEREYLSLEWTQTSPETWERKTDNFDKFFMFVETVGQGRPDKQNWFITAAVKIKTGRQDFVEDVKEVWKRMRYHYPIYAAIIQDNHWMYRIANKSELNSWLEETFIIHKVQQTARELYPFDANPTRRAVLHVLPNTQELVIQCPHTHCDAIGMAIFLNNMLRFLVAPSPGSELTFGKEGTNLQACLTITAEIPEQSASQKKPGTKYLRIGRQNCQQSVFEIKISALVPLRPKFNGSNTRKTKQAKSPHDRKSLVSRSQQPHKLHSPEQRKFMEEILLRHRQLWPSSTLVRI
jgi:hypothetical protein